MKKLLISLLLIISAGFVFAQNKEAFMMQVDGSLYTENADGELVWSSSVPVGTKVSILTVRDENKNTVLDEKDAKRKSNGKLIDCHVYHVTYNDKEYYVLSERVSTETNFAIIKTEAALYRTPDYFDAMDKTIAKGTFITVEQKDYLPRNTSVKYNTAGFNKIYYFDNNSWTVKSAYIRTINFGSSRDDLKAIQILSKLAESKDSKVNTELLNNLKTLTVSEGLEDQIIAEKEKALSGDLTSAGKSNYGKNMLIVNEDLSSPINVRSLPGTDGQIIAQIDYSGEEIYVSSKTNIQGYAGDSLNYWYEIEIPEDDGSLTKGWIFGDFLEEL